YTGLFYNFVKWAWNKLKSLASKIPGLTQIHIDTPGMIVRYGAKGSVCPGLNPDPDIAAKVRFWLLGAGTGSTVRGVKPYVVLLPYKSGKTDAESEFAKAVSNLRQVKVFGSSYYKVCELGSVCRNATFGSFIEIKIPDSADKYLSNYNKAMGSVMPLKASKEEIAQILEKFKGKKLHLNVASSAERSTIYFYLRENLSEDVIDCHVLPGPYVGFALKEGEYMQCYGLKNFKIYLIKKRLGSYNGQITFVPFIDRHDPSVLEIMAKLGAKAGESIKKEWTELSRKAREMKSDISSSVVDGYRKFKNKLISIFARISSSVSKAARSATQAASNVAKKVSEAIRGKKETKREEGEAVGMDELALVGEKISTNIEIGKNNLKVVAQGKVPTKLEIIKEASFVKLARIGVNRYINFYNPKKEIISRVQITSDNKVFESTTPKKGGKFTKAVERDKAAKIIALYELFSLFEGDNKLHPLEISKAKLYLWRSSSKESCFKEDGYAAKIKSPSKEYPDDYADDYFGAELKPGDKFKISTWREIKTKKDDEKGCNIEFDLGESKEELPLPKDKEALYCVGLDLFVDGKADCHVRNFEPHASKLIELKPTPTEQAEEELPQPEEEKPKLGRCEECASLLECLACIDKKMVEDVTQ
ncbi:MAG: hypothetical protein J7L14_01135, partial [Candidatus Diapherotrites archaeon]|nr:hypothetical protein [Candidatus Diapherotrites archaeon]